MGHALVAAVAASVLVAGVWTATAIGAAPNGQGVFVDDNGSIHEPDINGLAASGITRGCNPPADDRFCPDRAVTRQEMASFLVRALGLPRSPTSFFEDTAGSIHAHDIDDLAEAGITLGCNPPANTSYCPLLPVTRQQMASLLVRALDLPATERTYFDDTDGSIHAVDIDALAQADITRGCNPPSNTSFCPRETVTRAQMASFLVRAFGLSPQLNHLSMRSGLSCTKDSGACTGRVSLPPGVRLEVVEGWYQVTPYLPGEEATFTAPSTSVAFTWNGQEIPADALGLDAERSPATRLWKTRPPALTRGTHTLRATWRWAGDVTQTVTYVITVP